MAERLLVAESLGKTYGGAVPTVALSDVSFELAAGEFVALIGQSGSGKSTLLNLIGLLDRPTQGQVLIDGHDLGGASRRRRAQARNQHLGFVFQFHHLLPEFSVLENVIMPGRIAGAPPAQLRARAREVLALLDLDDLKDKNANALSGGQKQRVAIARALLNRPSLVLADEPTGNLDSGNSGAVYRLFRDLNQQLGTTFLIVTHERDVAQQADRILEIGDGKLIQDVRNPLVEVADRPPDSSDRPPV